VLDSVFDDVAFVASRLSSAEQVGQLETLVEENITAVSGEGGLEFEADIIGEAGDATSESSGTTYQKLLCVAFDLALLRTFLDQPFPRFVFHDGAFEQLEPRKQANLLAVFRRYSKLGLQPVVTALSNDLPEAAAEAALTAREMILTLHDDGEAGRLFKVPSW